MRNESVAGLNLIAPSVGNVSVVDACGSDAVVGLFVIVAVDLKFTQIVDTVEAHNLLKSSVA